MGIAGGAVIIPIGVLFFVSGLIVNLLQALIFITIRPLSKSLFRRINRQLAELLWLQLVWVVDWWSGVQVNLYTDPETLNMMGKEHALVIANHKSDIDWLIGWVFAQRSGCLGSTLAVMKKSSKFLPEGLQRLKDYPQPFWLALFVEGTRFTKAKLLAAQEYAASTGLPVPRNVLIPRTKGFVASVSEMRSFATAIIDMTVAVPKDKTPPTMLGLFKGQPSVIHVRVKRHLMKDLPETDEGVAQWCKDIFVAKDDLLDEHKIADSFPDSELHDIGRPLKSLVVVVSWACLLVLGTFKFLQWSNLLSSWKGLAFTAAGLGIVTILMQILIQFSQAERSTPAKVAPERSSNGSVQEKPH